MNDDLYGDLKLLLEHRLAVIGDHAFRDRDPGAHLNQLQVASEAISLWHCKHRAEIDANLEHFLSGASFDKALKYLATGVRTPCGT